MSNFWNEINESIYWSGCKSIVARLNDQYPNVSDEEYERIHMNLARQALEGDFSIVTKEEGYYMICENYSPLLANKALAF